MLHLKIACEAGGIADGVPRQKQAREHTIKEESAVIQGLNFRAVRLGFLACRISVITSQWVMIAVLLLIPIAWAVLRQRGCRSKELQKVFLAVSAQTVAAVCLAFSSGSLLLSTILVLVAGAAVYWMIRPSVRAS